MSPLSNNQEVSAFGENGKFLQSNLVSAQISDFLFFTGVGDSGDHWKLTCDGDFWDRDDEVAFKHGDTGAFLASSGQSYGRPISGQLEIIGLSRNDFSAKWQAAEGLFVHQSSFNPKQHHHRPEHSEL